MYGRKLTRRKTTRHRSKTTRHRRKTYRRKTTRHRKNIRGGLTPLKPDPKSEDYFGFAPSRSPPKYGFSPYASWHNKKLHNIKPTPPKDTKKNRKPVLKGKLNSPLPPQNPTPPKHKRTTAQNI